MIFKVMLDLLRDNKRFPYYAAERRIDLFINIFLEQILTTFYNEKVNFIVPEFPLKLGSNNQADKLDGTVPKLLVENYITSSFLHSIHQFGTVPNTYRLFSV